MSLFHLLHNDLLVLLQQSYPRFFFRFCLCLFTAVRVLRTSVLSIEKVSQQEVVKMSLFSVCRGKDLQLCAGCWLVVIHWVFLSSSISWASCMDNQASLHFSTSFPWSRILFMDVNHLAAKIRFSGQSF